ncbi:CDC45 family [Haematococcus lacustris]
MILSASQLLQLFDAMNQDKHSSEDKAVIIYAANGDVDSLCASYQLESILGKTDTYTSLNAVENYEALQRLCEKDGLHTCQDLKTVLMINCGATEDVRTLCNISLNVRIIIIDSHRPIWHGHNVEGDQNTIAVLDDDDPVPRSCIPDYNPQLEAGTDGKGGQTDEAAELDSEDDDDLGPGSSDQGRPRTGSRPGGDADSEGDGDDVPGPNGRRADQDATAGQRHQRERQQAGVTRDGHGERPRKRARITKADQAAHCKAVMSYYQFQAGYGKPSALLLLGLAHSQQQDDNFHVWLAILGVTDQYVHQRMSPALYMRWREELEGHVFQHNGQLSIGQQLEDNGPHDGQQNRRARQRVAVAKVSDLKLPLLKRWTLQDSLWYTNHIAVRLQTWKEKGRSNVHLMLAAMNVPLQQRTAEFGSMRPEVYPHVLSRFKDISSRFGLLWEALRYEGFEVRYKNDFRVLASDYVLALTALLGRPRDELNTEQDAFRAAFDCLMPHKQDGIEALKQGMERAKRVAMAVVRDGGLLVSQHAVHGHKDQGFWYMDLSHFTLSHAQEFRHHSALIKLAIFIRDVMIQRHRRAQGMVVVGPPDAQQMCYIVAVRDRMVSDAKMQDNPFSVPMQEALKELALGDSRATFDSSVYQVKQNCVHQVLAELKSVIASYKMAAGPM